MNFSTILLDVEKHLLEKYGMVQGIPTMVVWPKYGNIALVGSKSYGKFHGSHSCAKVTALEKQMALSKFEPCHKFRKNMDETDKALLGT